MNLIDTKPYTFPISTSLPREVDPFSIVFYHEKCNDGLTAYAAFCAASSVVPISKEVNYNLHRKEEGFNSNLLKTLDEFDINLTKYTLYVLDFWFKADDLAYLCGIFKKVVVIDHHDWNSITDDQFAKCADLLQGPYANKLEILHSKKASGAYLTWMYFNVFGKSDEPQTVPRVVHYANDHDLHLHTDPQTKHFVRGLWKHNKQEMFKYLFNSIKENDSSEENTNQITKLIDLGKMLISSEESLFDEIINSNLTVYKIFVKTKTGYKHVNVAAINAPSVFRTELPDYYFEKQGREKGIYLAVVWSANNDGTYRYSARNDDKAKNLDSEDPTDYFIKASLLANQYGGGGHDHAAGFSADKTPDKLFIR